MKRRKQSPVSEGAQALAKLRGRSPFRGITSWLATGNMNSSTAFGTGNFINSQIDIAEKATADSYGAQGEVAYNNWLSKERKPQMTVYPRAVGVFVDNAFNVITGAVNIKALLLKHATLEIKRDTMTILRQPLITLPSGLEIVESYATADTTTPDKQSRAVHGPMTPDGLFPFPKGDVVLTDKNQVKLFLKVESGALTYLQGLATALPTYGALVTVVLYGTADYPVGVAR